MEPPWIKFPDPSYSYNIEGMRAYVEYGEKWDTWGETLSLEDRLVHLDKYLPLPISSIVPAYNWLFQTWPNSNEDLEKMVDFGFLSSVEDYHESSMGKISRS